jgi:hypothetical protein
MTPEDCRANADQYVEWVHNVKTDYERSVYLTWPALGWKLCWSMTMLRQLCHQPDVFG